MINFDLAFTYLLGNEGTAYTHDLRDPGGSTKFGITLKSYQSFLRRSVSDFELANLNLIEARDFYNVMYWVGTHCDRLSGAAISICIFDTAVLYGPGTAAILAQKTVSVISGAALKFDGILGDNSIGLLNISREGDFLDAYHDLVLKRIDAVIVTNPIEEVFRDGWTSRADRLLTLTDLTSLIEETTKQEGST